MISPSSKSFSQSSFAEVVEAFFEITYRTAQEKARNIGKTLIKLYLLKAASLVLRET